MPQVVLTGWKPGFRKVALTRILQQRAGLSLAVAKECVDRCLAGERVLVEVPTSEAAEALVSEASGVGAIAELPRVEQHR